MVQERTTTMTVKSEANDVCSQDVGLKGLQVTIGGYGQTNELNLVAAVACMDRIQTRRSIVYTNLRARSCYWKVTTGWWCIIWSRLTAETIARTGHPYTVIKVIQLDSTDWSCGRPSGRLQSISRPVTIKTCENLEKREI